MEVIKLNKFDSNKVQSLIMFLKTTKSSFRTKLRPLTYCPHFTKFPQNKFSSLKISYKINSVIFIMAIFMGGIGLTGYVYYYNQNSAVNTMYATSLTSVNILNEASADIKATEALSMEMLLAPIEKIHEQELLNNIKNNDNDFDAAYNSVASLPQKSFGAMQLPQLKQAITSYRTARQKAFDMVNQSLLTHTNKQEAYAYYSTK